MSKPIYFTEAMKQEAMAEFKQAIDTMSCLDGHVKYETSYYWPQEKDEKGRPIEDFVTVRFSETATKKQRLLIDSFETEVGWHGIAHRDKEDETLFHIDDILVFPQEVGGASVDSDQQEQGHQWLLGTLTPEQFNSLRFHGHSHVNMSTSPSGTDNTFQQKMVGMVCGDGFKPEMRSKIVEQLGDSAFYVFMICNKKGEFHVRVFDVLHNSMYTSKEVHVEMAEDHSLDEFLNDARSKVKEKSYKYQSNSGKSTPAIPQTTMYDKIDDGYAYYYNH